MLSFGLLVTTGAAALLTITSAFGKVPARVRGAITAMMTAAARSSGLGRSCCGRQFRMQHQAQTDFRLRGCKRRRGGRLVWSLGRGQGGRINRGLGKRAIPAPSFRHRSGDVPMHCPAAPPDDEAAGRRYRMSGRRGGDRLSARVLTRRQTCGIPAIEIDTQREGKCDAM